MTLVLNEAAILTALFIFALRVLNNTLTTLRMSLLTRQERVATTFLAFFEALIFAITVGSVVKDLSNILNLGAYCFGFALGSYVGLRLEARLITSYVSVHIVMQKSGHELAAKLREHDFGVTITQGEGLNGNVAMLRSVVLRRDVQKVMLLVTEFAPGAFISVEEARAVHRGHIHPVRNQPY